MPNETEVKLPMRDLMPLNKTDLKVYEVTPRHFEDNWLLDTPQFDLRGHGTALRVRFANGTGTVTYKGPAQAEQSFKVREEIESQISDPDAMLEIFQRLGYLKKFRYQKYRTVMRIDLPDGRSLHAMFDETPIGNFLELEGEKEEILAIADRLGFKPEDFITLSYVALQYNYCQAMRQPLSDMVFSSGEAST
ncbi:MAG TPA: class IV adenylate cyclase [Blastocatellia bacterium]|nr:class IV adenylate cyclase [Blastocatellia bacterium]